MVSKEPCQLSPCLTLLLGILLLFQSIIFTLSRVLRALKDPFNVSLATLESIQYRDGQFVCWVTICCPGRACEKEKIIGDECNCMEDAEQSLAKKAVVFLQAAYGFILVDANYFAMDIDAMHCESVEKKLDSARSNLVDVKRPGAFSPIITGECVTPPGPGHQIPNCSMAPPLLNKARTKVSRKPSSTPGAFTEVPPNLSVVFKPIKLR